MLTLPIKNPWFSMIRAGEKREEYREETEYWRTRLETAFGKEIHQAAEQQAETWIRLRNGYGADRPSIQARVRLRIGQGRPEWGAEPGVEYYVLVIQAVYDEKAGMSLFWSEEPKPPAPQPAEADPATWTTMPDVIMFIGRFMHDGINVRTEVVEAFTCGCCYWFAHILAARFGDEYGAEIVVDYVANHFGTRIRGRVYDITGDVTEGHTWEPWDACDDDLLRKRITDDCIMF